MHDDEPTFLRTMTWADLLYTLSIDEALRTKLGVQLCPFTGAVEEYTLADRLGGELDIWPAKWRGVIEQSRAAETA
tara:strand:+ start:143 stop:370 length:228 start_codon:yes stop_codon:yes gene_type:complete